jgi:glycosyltransferase involved in cell wall biosynthesis
MLVNPMVSVIMPVYNAKDYVEIAIKSVLNQTYKDFEFIVVDDGATDGSSKICDYYAAKDNRIRLIHQKNKGISSARNTGLAIAKGKYVSFCDHDDIYFSDYLMKSVTTAEALNVSLVKFGHKSEYWKNGQLIKIIEEEIPDICIHISELSRNYPLLNLTVHALWNGLYLRSTIVENNIYFNEEIRAGMEDFLFNIKLLKHVNSIAYIPDVLFLHYGRFGLSTSLKYSKNRLNDIMVVQNEEAKWLASHGTNPKVIVQHRRKYLNLFGETLFHQDCPLPLKDKKKLLGDLQKSDQISNEGTLRASLAEIPRNLKVGIKDTLYCLKMYSVILLVWKLHNFN